MPKSNTPAVLMDSGGFRICDVPQCNSHRIVDTGEVSLGSLALTTVSPWNLSLRNHLDLVDLDGGFPVIAHISKAVVGAQDCPIRVYVKECSSRGKLDQQSCTTLGAEGQE